MPSFFARLRDDEGVSAVIVAVLITVLIGFTALVVDIGSLALERRRLQSAADAAALAGVQELPADLAGADSFARTYAGTNRPGCTVDEVLIYTTSSANDTIKVTVSFPSPLYFSRIWGFGGQTVHASAVAQVQSPTGYGPGVMPLGIMSRDPSATLEFGYTFGELVRLKQPAGTGEDVSGNFQFLSLTDPPDGHDGNNDIKAALSGGGVDNNVWMWEDYNTKTGINGNTVANSLNLWIGGDTHSFEEVTEPPDENGVARLTCPEGDDGCHRIIICPIIINPAYPEDDPLRYNWSDVNGSKDIQIIGFAYFYVQAVGTTGNDCYLDGIFIRTVAPNAIRYGGLNPLGGVYYGLIE